MLNGFVAVAALFFAAIPILLTAVSLLVWLVFAAEAFFSGESIRSGNWGGDGPGMAGGGVAGGALALVAILVGAIVSLVFVLPFGTWLFLIARWLRCGDSRGRQQLWWCSWIVIGVTAILWVWAAVVMRDPITKNVFATPVILWAAGNLIGLRASERKAAAIS